MTGPGTELKQMFSLMLLDATPECLCHPRAALMDQMGSRWCVENIETIVDWLEEQASERKMAFDREVARRLALIAIKRGSTRHARLRISKPGHGADQLSWYHLLRKHIGRAALFVGEPAIRLLFAWKRLRRESGWFRRRERRAEKDFSG